MGNSGRSGWSAPPTSTVVENADVIIDNVSTIPPMPLNALLNAGKTVAMITEGEERRATSCAP